MARVTKATRDLAIEMLEAIRDVGDRHKLHPSRPDDCRALITTAGAVLIAIVQVADPAATSITIRQEVRDGRKGTGITIHHESPTD